MTFRELPRTLSMHLLAGALLALPIAAFADEPTSAPAPGAAATAAATPIPSGEAIMDRFIEAMGGVAALDGKRNVVTTGKVVMAAQGLNGIVTIYQARPDKLLVVTEIPGIGKMEQGFDGKVGWGRDPMQGPRIIQGGELEQMKLQNDLFSAAEYKKIFTTIENVGKATFEGQDVWKVRQVMKGGVELTSYYGVADGRQLGMEMQADTPMGKIPVTVVIAEYRQFGPITMPTRMTSKVMGMEQAITIDKVEFDVADLPSFSPPPDLVAPTATN